MSVATVCLQAQGLSVERGGKRVLDGLDLSLRRGELLVLVGPNGSGKSTALRSLAGVQKTSAGQVYLQGQPLAQLDPLQRARCLAYLPQDFRSQWDLSVTELIALGASRGGTRGSPAQTEALLGSLDIAALRTRRLSQLSGGERARAALAWALAAGSPLLLADEPTAALDIGHQLSLMHYLRSQLPHCAQILVLHDLGLAMRFADRIAVLANGCLLAVDTPQRIRHSGALESAFAVELHWVDTADGAYPIARQGRQPAFSPAST